MRIIQSFLFLFITMNIFSQSPQSTNKHFWHSLKTIAEPQQIWAVWTDVSNWYEWDTGLKAAELKGFFELGAKGSITSLEGRKSKFKIVAYEAGRSYTFRTNLPLAKLYVKRYLEEKNGTIYFTHEVWFKGLAASLFAKRFGSQFRELLPQVMENIRQRVE